MGKGEWNKGALIIGPDMVYQRRKSSTNDLSCGARRRLTVAQRLNGGNEASTV